MRSRVWAVLISFLLSAPLVGCSGDASNDDVATPSTSATASESSSSTESPATPDPTEDAEPKGPEIVIDDAGDDVFRFDLPAGEWRITGGGRRGAMDVPQGTATIGAFTNTAAPGTKLDFYARVALDVYPGGTPKLRRVENRVVDGVEGFVLEGSGPDGLVYVYGAPQGETLLTLTFDFPVDNQAGRDRIETVLAGATWL